MPRAQNRAAKVISLTKTILFALLGILFTVSMDLIIHVLDFLSSLFPLSTFVFLFVLHQPLSIVVGSLFTLLDVFLLGLVFMSISAVWFVLIYGAILPASN